jgi:hypothetical protein
MASHRINNEALKIEDVPAPDAEMAAISRFARTYDGYQRFADQPTPGKIVAACGKFANDVYRRYLECGERPESLDDLRTILFFESVRYRMELDPRNLRESYISRIIEKMAAVLSNTHQ